MPPVIGRRRACYGFQAETDEGWSGNLTDFLLRAPILSLSRAVLSHATSVLVRNRDRNREPQTRRSSRGGTGRRRRTYRRRRDDHGAGRMGERPKERGDHFPAPGLGEGGRDGRGGGILYRLHASERGGSLAGRFLGEQRALGNRHSRAALALSSVGSRLRDRAANGQHSVSRRVKTGVLAKRLSS